MMTGSARHHQGHEKYPGYEFGPGLPETERLVLGYQLTLGIGVAAGLLQVLFSLLRAGRLADFFPLTPVHGMLVSIGIMLIAKQLYEVIGLTPTPGVRPLQLLAEFPSQIQNWNPEIALIGVLGLTLLLVLSRWKIRGMKYVPMQLIVLIVAIGLGYVFDLEHQHTYLFHNPLFTSGQPVLYEVGPRCLVDMPKILSDPGAAFVAPDFRGLATATGIQYLLLFSLIGSLESLLGAKAIELIDPWKRKTNFDRDLLAIGLGNICSAAIGGLPMISEVVRSKANIDNGARTRWANAWHGLFLLGFVLLFPHWIHRIPLAALSAMLIYTGLRLAAPRKFVRTYKLGSEQFLIFLGTILTTLLTHLLIGIVVGILLEIIVLVWHGCTIASLFHADLHVVPEGDRIVRIRVRQAAVFANWLGLRRTILQEAKGREEVVLDLSETRLVDHSVLEKLHRLQYDFAAEGKTLLMLGLEHHRPLSSHPLATRKIRRENEPVVIMAGQHHS